MDGLTGCIWANTGHDDASDWNVRCPDGAGRQTLCANDAERRFLHAVPVLLRPHGLECDDPRERAGWMVSHRAFQGRFEAECYMDHSEGGGGSRPAQTGVTAIAA